MNSSIANKVYYLYALNGLLMGAGLLLESELLANLTAGPAALSFLAYLVSFNMVAVTFEEHSAFKRLRIPE